MTKDQDRIAQLDAEIATLYAEVEHLESKRKSVTQNDDGDGTDERYVRDVRSRTLREQARALDGERSKLLEVARKPKPDP